jgi:hypothetical protein
MSVFYLLKGTVRRWPAELALQKPRRRKKGYLSQHPNQLASAYVMKTLYQAVMSVSEAADAMHCPANTSSGPYHRLVLIVVCEVKDTDPNGGELSRYHRDIPKVTILSQPKEDTKAVITAYCTGNAFEHRVTNDYEKVI